jgi:hypothetical protein
MFRRCQGNGGVDRTGGRFDRNRSHELEQKIKTC